MDKEEVAREHRRLTRENKASWAEIFNKTEEYNREREALTKPVIELLRKELGDDAEHIIQDKEELADLVDVSVTERLQRITLYKKKFSQMRATSSTETVEEPEQIKAIKEKQQLVEAIDKAESERAAKKARARALFIEQLKKEFDDPDAVQEALDAYDQAMLAADRKRNKG